MARQRSIEERLARHAEKSGFGKVILNMKRDHPLYPLLISGDNKTIGNRLREISN